MTTTVPISIATAEHYAWGDACDGWHLVRAAGLSVIQERMPRGTSERRHVHRRARQFFYVLRGALRIEVDGVAHAVGAGAGIELAPGLAHQVANASDGDTEFLVISQPPSHGDREAAPLD